MNDKHGLQDFVKLGVGKLREARLGDKLENIFILVGVDKAVKKYEEVTGHDCGCEKRKKILNLQD